MKFIIALFLFSGCGSTYYCSQDGWKGPECARFYQNAEMEDSCWVADSSNGWWKVRCK